MTFVAFAEIHDTGKTKMWEVRNSNDGSYLGVIRWHGAWRKYVLDSCVYTMVGGVPCRQPTGMAADGVALPTLWSEDCLRDVAAFVKNQMDLRRVSHG